MSSQLQQLKGSSNQSFYFQLPIAPSPYEVSIPIPPQQRPSFSPQDSNLTFIPLRDRKIENVSIMQLIKNIFSENSKALQEQSAIAYRRAVTMRVLAISLVILGGIGVGGCMSIPFAVSSVGLSPTNSTKIGIPVLGGFATAIGLAIIIFSVIECNGYLLDKRKKELQFSKISEEFEKINPNDFTKFVAAEMFEFEDLQQKIQTSIQTDPRKFLEILYLICQIFTKWKGIEESKQTLTNYGAVNETILSKVRDLDDEVQQDLQDLLEKGTDKKQSHIESLSKQIREEKEILKKLLS